MLDCSGGADTTKIIVIVNPPPSAILGVASVCAGLTTTLNDPIGIGTWSSNNTSIATVTPGPAAAGTVTGVSAGVTTITYTPGAGCSVTRDVTVNVAPGPITGSRSICLGSTGNLADTTAGGAWSSSALAIATVTGAGVVSGVALGTATITYSHGGCPSMAFITVNPMPAAISGLSFLCVGNSVTFFDVTAGGTWSTGSSVVATAAPSGTISAAGAGTANVLYTLPTGCAAVFPITVYPLPGPVTGSTLICAGTTSLLTDTTAGGVWSLLGPSASVYVDSFTGIVTGLSPGSATVVYVTGFGCSASVSVSVNASPSPVVGLPTLCSGGYTYLGDPTLAGTWSSSSTGIATVDSVSGAVLGLTGGTAIISYSISNRLRSSGYHYRKSIAFGNNGRLLNLCRAHYYIK